MKNQEKPWENIKLPRIFKAKISNGWILFRNTRIIETFRTESDLNVFWEKNGERIEGFKYKLDFKKPPLAKIGNLFFESKWIPPMLNEKFQVICKNDIYVIQSIKEDIIASFDSQEEFKKWEAEYLKWKEEKILKKQRKTELEQKRKLKLATQTKLKTQAKRKKKRKKKYTKSNMILTDSYKMMKRDPDWFREQS
ncbi:MAG: hypothetical protein K0B37_16240 [Bacteroidales bacterium]|nr:hypothetical protein [Bacteroidales bacterium]